MVKYLCDICSKEIHLKQNDFATVATPSKCAGYITTGKDYCMCNNCANEYYDCRVYFRGAMTIWWVSKT